jgi:hypothetical protein
MMLKNDKYGFTQNELFLCARINPEQYGLHEETLDIA